MPFVPLTGSRDGEGWRGTQGIRVGTTGQRIGRQTFMPEN